MASRKTLKEQIAEENYVPPVWQTRYPKHSALARGSRFTLSKCELRANWDPCVAQKSQVDSKEARAWTEPRAMITQGSMS